MVAKLGPQGAASHVVPVRIQDQCSETAKANTYRQRTATGVERVEQAVNKVAATVERLIGFHQTHTPPHHHPNGPHHYDSGLLGGMRAGAGVDAPGHGS